MNIDEGIGAIVGIVQNLHGRCTLSALITEIGLMFNQYEHYEYLVSCIDEAVYRGEIIEIRYLIPSEVGRSIYFPKGTTLISAELEVEKKRLAIDMVMSVIGNMDSDTKTDLMENLIHSIHSEKGVV